MILARCVAIGLFVILSALATGCHTCQRTSACPTRTVVTPTTVLTPARPGCGTPAVVPAPAAPPAPVYSSPAPNGYFR